MKLSPDHVSEIHSLLRRETATLHEEVDRGLRFLVSPELTRERYRRVLLALRGIERPLELALAPLASAKPPLPVPLLDRATLLEQDLAALGMPWSAVAAAPVCDHLPALRTLAHRAGALYVTEGACLGGQVIARALARHLGLDASNGASFFLGSASATAQRWRLVLAWLEEFAPAAGAAAIAWGAQETFAAFARWLRARGVTAPESVRA